MLDFLTLPEAQVVAVCDVNEGSADYMEWGQYELRDKTRETLKDSAWGEGVAGAQAGMKPAQDIVQRYYAAQGGRSKRKRCAAYRDYRELFDKEKDFDAVLIGTPDHVHAPIAVQAMRLGKHVYCQKPMSHTVHEARVMARVATETGVATQVATGNSASEATRLLCEWVWAGAIGPVREVHNWSSRPLWPQGLDRPAAEDPVPPYLDWNLWLGPAAMRPYSKAYQPFIWRGWFDFGTGTVGDMGCYSFETIFRVLKLGAPIRVSTSSTKVYPESFPAASLLHFQFPARGEMPPVSLHWYDGGLRPEKPEELTDAEFEDEGLLFVGDSGKILCGFNGSNPHLIPESAMTAFKQPPQTLPRSIGHNEEWLAACKGGDPAGARFEVAAPVTETILLGNVALRAGTTIDWDTATQMVTNNAEANALLHFDYREGWAL
ncbi:MAG: Gfo/Idh/MocA family oxidoreductase [Candidatus Hydrogenedentes bacterium]|nr:Gfo/Idh/MocA family oxidoreductase [Candidatus Hydrogenedentota bacterium]